MNPLATAIAGSFAALRAVAGTDAPVTYRRGPAAASLTPVVGKTDHELEDAASGLVTRLQTRDYLVAAADLVLDHGVGQTELKPRDRVVEDGRAYEVLDVAGQGCFRYCDAARTRLRIHTKYVGPA